jgi:cytochrome c553
MKHMIWAIAVAALLAGYSQGKADTSDNETTSEGPPGAGVFDQESVLRVASSCNDCHGEGGVSTTAHIPHLAGQRMTYLITEIKAYQEGERENAPMHAVVTALNDRIIRYLGAYYALRGVTAETQMGAPPEATSEAAGSLRPDLAELVEKCDLCHVGSGYADPGQFPILTGQHEEYLIGAMRSYQDRFLRDSSLMHAMTDELNPEDVATVAAHYAHRWARERVGGPREE